MVYRATSWGSSHLMWQLSRAHVCLQVSAFRICTVHPNRACVTVADQSAEQPSGGCRWRHARLGMVHAPAFVHLCCCCLAAAAGHLHPVGCHHGYQPWSPPSCLSGLLRGCLSGEVAPDRCSAHWLDAAAHLLQLPPQQSKLGRSPGARAPFQALWQVYTRPGCSWR